MHLGTYDGEGRANAMNAAWGGQWDMREIMISLGSHQTTDNLQVNSELTVGFATRDTLVAADYVGLASGRSTPDKMARTGWTVEKAPRVNAPLFRELPLTQECRVKQKLDESKTGYYLIGSTVGSIIGITVFLRGSGGQTVGRADRSRPLPQQRC